jgi:hypothetical protein
MCGPPPGQYGFGRGSGGRRAGLRSADRARHPSGGREPGPAPPGRSGGRSHRGTPHPEPRAALRPSAGRGPRCGPTSQGRSLGASRGRGPRWPRRWRGTSSARTGRPSAKRKSSRSWKRRVRSSSHSQLRASSGARPAVGSARVRVTWSRSATRALIASTPKRGSTLCGSLSSAMTSPDAVSGLGAHALKHIAHAFPSRTRARRFG